MSEVISFKCPNCGSSLNPNGTKKTIICSYCGSSVIVPEELRDQDQETHEELTPEQDLFTPRHVDWLVQNGIDTTVKIDWLKERDETKNNNPVVDMLLVGKKANGKKFDNMATINVPRNQVPKKGSTIKIKYNKKSDDMVEDFIMQIGGEYIYAFTSDDPTDLLNL
jgi:DNA-directed RNA polymerase subunit RPC12/RpoP